MQPSPYDSTVRREPSLVQLLAVSTYQLHDTLDRMDVAEEALGLVESDGLLVHVNRAWLRAQDKEDEEGAILVHCGALLPGDAPAWLASGLSRVLDEVLGASSNVAHFEARTGSQRVLGEAARVVDSSGTYALLALRRAA